MAELRIITNGAYNPMLQIHFIRLHPIDGRWPAEARDYRYGGSLSHHYRKAVFERLPAKRVPSASEMILQGRTW